MVESSEVGLVVIQQLYSEGAISDDERDNLKDMIFDEDAILLSLISRYEDEVDEIKAAIVKYCRGGVMEASRPSEMNLASVEASEDLEQASSPTDSALDFKKRKLRN